jgi:ATP-dependent helicase/nuclease subunit A
MSGKIDPESRTVLAREFTSEQKKAIEALGSDVVVAAGAGSGKTGVLVERFVRIITHTLRAELPPEQQAGVENILVITFTEKATKEMKQRIVAELNRHGLVAERRQVETAYISTIHGFCSRLLQENPFEAGVDPEFRVLDEKQARQLLRQAFEHVTAQAYATGDAGIVGLLEAGQTERQYGDTGEPLQALAEGVEAVLNKLRGAGRSRQELEQHWRAGAENALLASEAPIRALLAPLQRELQAVRETLEAALPHALGTFKLLLEPVLAAARQKDPEAVGLNEMLTTLGAAYKALTNQRPRLGATRREMELAQVFGRLKALCEGVQTLFQQAAGSEEERARFGFHLWGLALAVWEAYDAAKAERGALDNDDLQAEGVRLLEASPTVRDRYRRQFRHLMVDEFQDTNALQMRLLDLLHVPDDIRKNNRETDVSRNYLFIVGDVQQSIYAFRNADPTLFRGLERRYRESGVGTHVQLAANFRSRPEILDVVTRVFSEAWRHEETPFVPLTPGAEFAPKTTPSLELLLTEGVYRRDYVTLEAEALAARIGRLVEARELCLTARTDPRCGEPIAYRDIAVLFRALTDIQKYEEAFARRGLPCFVVGGGRGYYARPEIRDLVNVLTVIDTPMNDVALAATLRSPFVGVEADTLTRLAQLAQSVAPAPSASSARRPPDPPLYPALYRLEDDPTFPPAEAARLRKFVEILDRLREQEDRLPVGHLLERLISQTLYDARLLCRPNGRRRLANVRKLLQMANSDSTLGIRGFVYRVRDMERLTAREGDAPTEEEAADVVKFLTIHSAKGLEFPVVILADLSRNLVVPERGLFVCEPQTFAIGTKLGGEPNLTYRAIAQQREAADKKEYDRLLYVAMTRAREHLILCGNLGRNKGTTWSNSLFTTLGVLEAPPEPTQQVLRGGLTARLAPLTHDMHAPQAGDARSTAGSPSDLLPDRLVQALLDGDPTEDLFPAEPP